MRACGCRVCAISPARAHLSSEARTHPHAPARALPLAGPISSRLLYTVPPYTCLYAGRYPARALELETAPQRVPCFPAPPPRARPPLAGFPGPPPYPASLGTRKALPTALLLGPSTRAVLGRFAEGFFTSRPPRGASLRAASLRGASVALSSLRRVTLVRFPARDERAAQGGRRRRRPCPPPCPRPPSRLPFFGSLAERLSTPAGAAAFCGRRAPRRWVLLGGRRRSRTADGVRQGQRRTGPWRMMHT